MRLTFLGHAGVLHRDRARLDPLRPVVPPRVLRVVGAVPGQRTRRRLDAIRAPGLPLHHPLARRPSRRPLPHRARVQGRGRHPPGLPDRRSPPHARRTSASTGSSRPATTSRSTSTGCACSRTRSIAPTDGAIGDSGLAVADGTATVFNQNDSKPIDFDALDRFGPFDAHFVQFSGAIWYPMVYRLPIEEKQALGPAQAREPARPRGPDGQGDRRDAVLPVRRPALLPRRGAVPPQRPRHRRLEHLPGPARRARAHAQPGRRQRRAHRSRAPSSS